MNSLAQALKTHQPQNNMQSNENDSTYTNPQIAVDSTSILSQNQPSNMNRKQLKQRLSMYASIGLFAVIAGVATGYGGYQLQAQSGTQTSRSNQSSTIQQVAGPTISVGDIFGVDDTDTFSDSAQGYLEAGGINGEGSHRLLRPGGESQTVYLTSSITDLDPLVGMDVRVHGETFKGQEAGWLMDVGRVEIIKTSGDRPITE